MTAAAKPLINRASDHLQPTSASIDARAAVKVFDAAARAGVPPQTLGKAAGVDLALLRQSDAQMPFNTLVALYEHAAQLTDDEAFGVSLGQESDHSKYDLLGYLLANSQTYGDALEHLVRYLRVWTGAVQFRLARAGREARLAYIYAVGAPAPDLRRQEAEHMLSTMLHVGRQLTGQRWKPKAVRFEHRKPPSIAAHKRVFEAPVYFSCAQTELVFSAQVLELSLPKADPALATLLERNARALLGTTTPSSTFADQVRQEISKVSAPGDVQLSAVARKLGTSARTLQRRLAENGSSFHELVRETRSSLAKNYLRKGELAICEIAYLLGFSEPSAFHRAFQRWTGTTPRTFRNSR